MPGLRAHRQRAVSLPMTADEAVAVLVELSQSTDRTLRDVAQALVEQAVAGG